mgnify:CR=1 FL=1
MNPPISSLLERVNAISATTPHATGETVRACLNILAGQDDRERKTVRIYDKIVGLESAALRAAALDELSRLTHVPSA